MKHINISNNICYDPVFIIGSPRSGTSALAWALAQHSGLWVSGEIHILFSMFGPHWLEQRFEQETRLPKGWFEKQEVELGEFFAYLGLGMNALFTSRSGGKRWVEQTPVNTLIVDRLAAIFPGALFLHILRDGCQVVNSMVRFENSMDEDERALCKQRNWSPPWASDFREACRTWRGSVDTAMQFGDECPDRYLAIRHENLVADPRLTFSEIFQFLRLPFEESAATYIKNNRLHSSYRTPADAVGRGIDESAPPSRWTADEIQTFAEEAGATMARAGYSMPTEDPVP